MQTLAGAFQAGAGGGNALSGAAGVVADEAFLSRVGTLLNNQGLDADSSGHAAVMNLASAAMGLAAGSAIGGSAGSGAAVGMTAQQNGYFDYRDGRRQTLQWQSQALQQLAGGDQNLVQAEAHLLDKAMKAGADPGDLAASLTAPGVAEKLAGMALVESASRRMFSGTSFDDLSDAQKQTVLASIGTVTVGSTQGLGPSALPGQDVASTGNASQAPAAGDSATPIAAGSEADGLRYKIGSAVSGVITNSGLGVEKAVNWVGQDTATALGYVALAAMGGPAKAAQSYLWNVSPLGQAVQAAKEDYLVNPAANFIGMYGFGAQTDAQQQAVYPASHAASSMGVDAILSAIGAVTSGQGARGIVQASEGFGDEVKQADEAIANTRVNSSSAPSPALIDSPYSPSNVDARIKPPYQANPAHDKGSPLFNPKKTPEPIDAQGAYGSAIRGGMGTWYAKGKDGYYRYFSDNAGTVHFSGVVPVAQVPNDVRKMLGD